MIFALAIVAMTTTTASAQSSGPANAFFGGLGAYPTGGSYQPLPPQTARQKAATKRALEMLRRGQLSKPRYGSSGYIGQ